ncbi:MAG: hypothetical protein FJX47_01530 [Alphaproteobacteria bacterium]|nr:hypothetical protein [Alphaproteobacteria bacterium]
MIRRVVAALAVLVLVAACESGPAIVSTGPDDTPAAAVAKGNSAMEVRNWGAAEAAFSRAVGLDDRYLDGYRGLARVALASGQATKGFAPAEKGRDLAGRDGKSRRLFQAVLIDLNAAEGRDGWYTRGGEIYWQELQNDPTAWTDGPIHLALGKSAAKAEDYPEATRLLRIAIRLNGPEKTEANRELARLDDAVRASLGDPALAAIARKPGLTRAELVKVLFDDFGILDYLGAKAPAEARPGETATDGTSDYARNPAAERIRALHRLRLRGVETLAGHFRPDAAATREEFAMLAEDLVVRKTGDSGLSRRYIGSESPFTDLTSTRASFNAMMSAISRGILLADIQGRAQPTEPLTGTAAILALRALRGLDPKALAN